MVHRIQKVSLESLANEKLSKQMIKAIDAIELEVWDKSEPGLSLKIEKRKIKLRLKLDYEIEITKFITWFSGIGVAIGGAITILKWLIPILIGYYANSPP